VKIISVEEIKIQRFTSGFGLDFKSSKAVKSNFPKVSSPGFLYKTNSAIFGPPKSVESI